MTDRQNNLLRSVRESTWGYYVWVGLLSAVVLWGVYAYTQQLRYGLVMTGMRDQVSWGIYITNFVFFIGISHVGALLSAILRFSDAEWRRPITRMAEAITTSSLFIGGLMPMIDMGRPDRLYHLAIYPRIQSPVLWDILSISTYFTGSTLFFWSLLIPDIALLRDLYPPGWRKSLYRLLALGYRGTKQQRHFLERGIFAVTLIILPLAISVHTVVSWIFAMTLRPGWDSTIFGPYFVVGALYSGCASVILAMYVFRRLYHLEGYLEPLHFRNLGLLLLVLTMLYLYFNVNEYVTVGYKFAGTDKRLLERLFFGDYSGYFWGVQTIGVLIPMFLLMAVLGIARYQQFMVAGISFASVLVVAGAWVKRYLIIIPTLGSPYLPGQGLPWEWAHYRPSWVEWSITAGGFAGFLLIYTILSSLFPIVSIWETQNEAPETEAEVRVSPATRGWGATRTVGLLLMAGVLLGGRCLRAQPPTSGKKPAATALSVEFQVLPEDKVPPAPEEAAGAPSVSPNRVLLFSGRTLGLLPTAQAEKEKKAPPAIAVTATLRDDKGLPLAFQAVDFSLQSSLGVLRFGSRPTDGQGKAQVILRDRRYGQYPVQASYRGDETRQASSTAVLVDFGPRPAPALPEGGVLITPYATPAVGLPFLLFYGTIWAVFFYAFGYLILWRMRRNA